MDTSLNDNFDELPSVETPEDVAVLYSWANLHGAKYRDFSASRREYRAQLRHRTAEQTRDVELRAQADAEAAVSLAEQNAREAEQAAAYQRAADAEATRLRALREAEHAAQVAAAERIEAARRAEAAAQAEAAARREEREIAEAHASARRKAARLAEAESRRRPVSPDSGDYDVPGSISDPYTPHPGTPNLRVTGESPAPPPPAAAVELHPARLRMDRAEDRPSRPAATPTDSSAGRTGFEQIFLPPSTPPPSAPVRRPQGYRPDDASGVRQIYRPEPEAPAPARPAPASSSRPRVQAPVPPYATRETTLPRIQATAEEADTEQAPRAWTPAPTMSPALEGSSGRPTLWAGAAATPPSSPVPRSVAATPQPLSHGPQDLPSGEIADPTPKRRRQDLPGYRATDSDRALAAYRREQAQPIPYANAAGRAPSSPDALTARPPVQRRDARDEHPAPLQRAVDPALPAWIHDQSSSQANLPSAPAAPSSPAAGQVIEPSVSDTLQRSRERVASRWYALKGVFEQPGQNRQEPPPARQKETRTPVLAVFSLAGGVGKTSLVATLGRSLSSLGEKVLLTDTTSHGLLPFYFGASELRPGTVRTFSPPSGSTDAPIYMVNYAVDQAPGDDAAQQRLVDEVANSGRGAHRILLDLTSSTGWIVRQSARLSPTVLVPLAPDMNSIISLGAIEKYFHGINGPDGTPLKVFYVLNQFDASLPLHLDVREVLRRQLGDRLLPIAIRRAPAVSEALAEGMTIVDYAADAPVAGDYMNIATWLRSLSAPATAGFRNVRWSER